MNGKTAAAIVVVLVLIVAGVFWWTGRDSDDDGADEGVASELSDAPEPTRNNFYGNQTQAPTYEVDPGAGDDGGNAVETLPELSVPMDQPAEYYITTMCDHARLYQTLNQQQNKDDLRQWFADAPEYIGPYVDGDDTLQGLVDTAGDSQGDPEAVLAKCD